MKKVNLLSAALFGLSIMTGCGKKGPTVSIVYEGEEGTAAFAIDEIKKSFERNNIRFTDEKADYTITLKEDSAQYEEQAYGITVSGKDITITGGDRVGLMYGGLELAEMIPSLKESVNPETAKELYNIVLDQETLGYLSGFYAYHIEAALMLRRYNDSQEESFRQDALSACNQSIEYFTKFADSYDARFQVERLARHGVIDVKQMLETLKKEISTIEKWKPRNY